ncbi:hypothetical protein [Streptomyces sp. NPDC048659]|uniref:hypothetical protein n=1 Tax=Streptomyces sp. NPDC048659 TaxID=3155489 RepID=UPI00343B67E3
MKAHQRAAGAVAALVLGAGSLLTAAPTATAAPSSETALNCSAQLIATSQNKGANITCTGGWFTGIIDCKRTDNGYVYRHFGNRVPSGGTSTVWCDVTANVIWAGGTPT